MPCFRDYASKNLSSERIEIAFSGESTKHWVVWYVEQGFSCNLELPVVTFGEDNMVATTVKSLCLEWSVSQTTKLQRKLYFCIIFFTRVIVLRTFSMCSVVVPVLFFFFILFHVKDIWCPSAFSSKSFSMEIDL